ncbi:MAG: type II secretion system protein GspL [Pseudomonadota bacterium]
MSASLIVLLPTQENDPDAGAPWALSDGVSRLAEGVLMPGESWVAPADQPAPERLIAVMPAEDVFAARVSTPARTEREARQAAPFLIEERLAQPLERAVIELGPRLENDERLLFAIDRAVLAPWRERVTGFPLRLVHAIPDAMLLSGRRGDLTVMAIGERVLFQTRGGDLSEGLPYTENAGELPLYGALDAGLVAPVLGALGARIKPKRMLVSPEIDAGLIAPDDEPIAVKRQSPPDLAVAAAALEPEALALLPGLFSNRRGAGAGLLERAMPWRAAAGLLLAAALGWAGLNAGEAVYYQNRAEAYREASEAVFRAEFPDITRVVNPRAQLAQRLSELGAGGQAGGGFLELASGLARLLEEVEEIQVNTLRFDAQRGALSVSAAYQDFSDFERLREAAERQGLILTDGGARQSESGVAGEFSLSLGAG